VYVNNMNFRTTEPLLRAHFKEPALCAAFKGGGGEDNIAEIIWKTDKATARKMGAATVNPKPKTPILCIILLRLPGWLN
jgi:hypothetical protein